MEKLTSMQDEMIRLLQEAGADDVKVQRYRTQWGLAEQERKVKKQELERLLSSWVWPCPMCYAKEPRVKGEIVLFGQQDKSSSARCNKCGHLPTDFVTPE